MWLAPLPGLLGSLPVFRYVPIAVDVNPPPPALTSKGVIARPIADPGLPGYGLPGDYRNTDRILHGFLHQLGNLLAIAPDVP